MSKLNTNFGKSASTCCNCNRRSKIVNWLGKSMHLFSSEQKIPCQHACYTRNLFLFVHYIVTRYIRLEIKCYFPADSEKREIDKLF